VTLLHDAYTALLAGLTYKTGNEIHWHDKDGSQITVEPVDVEAGSYIVRRYCKNGSLDLEENYSKEQLHGKRIIWHLNGKKFLEGDYHQGQLHGKCMGWYPNGQLDWEANYIQGQRHGLSIRWYKNGYCRDKNYYICGRIVTPKEWERYSDSTT